MEDSTEISAFDVAAEFTLTIPGTVVCGITAAQRHRMRLPQALRHDVGIHLARVDGLDRIRRSGVVGSRATYLPGEVLEIDGIPVTSPARTFLDLARLVRPDALIAAGDGLINRHETGPNRGIPPICAEEELREVVARHPGASGIRAARAALERMRPGSDSYPETMLRLTLEDHGLGGWELDTVLHGEDGDVFPDLLHRDSMTSLQFEGLHHDEIGQRRRDIRRQRRTEQCGAVEVRIFGEDLRVRERWRGRWVPRAVALAGAAVYR